MSITVPLDYHVHSNFSSDAGASIHALCMSAIDQGLPEIGLSEHYDLHPKESKPVFYRPEAWWEEFERVRRELNGQLILRAGIEIGEPHRFPDEIRDLLSHYPYDYVIGSLHYVGGDLMLDNKLLAERGADGILQIYFQELAEMTRAPQFDILGHFDVPVRNGKPIWGSYDPRRYEAPIRTVLQNCIDHKLSLDINSGGLRKPAMNLMPDPLILQWYRQMGGERLTLGSDAHAAEQVGMNLDRALEAVKTAGLKTITHYHRRCATLQSLV